MKNEKRKLASFDIDGTVFRSSLLIKLIEVLIELKVFPDYAKAEYLPAYEKWMNRQGSYDDYIKAVVAVFEKNIKFLKNYSKREKNNSRIYKNVLLMNFFKKINYLEKI